MSSLLWIFYMPLLVLCGFFGGIFLIITSIKHLKLFVGLMGLLSLSFVILPFVFWGMGVNSDTILPYFNYFILDTVFFNWIIGRIKWITGKD